MKKYRKILVTGCAMLALATICMGAGLYVPNTDEDNLGRSDKNFGTVFATRIKATGTSTNQDLVVNDSLTVGTNLTISTDGTFSAPAGVIPSSNLADRATIIGTITATISTNANGGTNTITYTAKDIAGGTVTTPFAFRTWISDTTYGALAAVAGDFEVTDGMELQQVVDKADYWVVGTNATGTAVVELTDTPGGTNFIHTLSPLGKRTTVTSAFNEP